MQVDSPLQVPSFFPAAASITSDTQSTSSPPATFCCHLSFAFGWFVSHLPAHCHYLIPDNWRLLSPFYSYPCFMSLPPLPTCMEIKASTPSRQVPSPFPLEAVTLPLALAYSLSSSTCPGHFSSPSQWLPVPASSRRLEERNVCPYLA